MHVISESLALLGEMENKRVLITGGAGFVGSTLAETIVDYVARLVVLDNLSTGSVENLERVSSAHRTKFSFVHGDVRRPEDCVKASSHIDIVFHLAAQINPAKAVSDPVLDFDVNARGTLNILEAARQNDVAKFVFASTNVYGTPKYVPTDETHPIDLLSPYAASKLAGEGYSIVYHNTYGIRTARLRFSNIYGPRQTTKSESGVVALFLQHLFSGQPLVVFGDGEQTRDFVYVMDIVQGLVRASILSAADGESFNIGFGAETSINWLAEQLPAIAGKVIDRKFETSYTHGPIRSADFRRGWMDITKARRTLGYNPTVSLEDGLKETVKWYARSIDPTEK